ncbi:hypothetical protein AB1Y20_013977 [Prymnesium parvum]|uniref:Uncharacterized protein n=1 Tax=Prymnesium parvum TaxID=97485 RepID=A0AB34IET9_PRYPA
MALTAEEHEASMECDEFVAASDAAGGKRPAEVSPPGEPAPTRSRPPDDPHEDSLGGARIEVPGRRLVLDVVRAELQGLFEMEKLVVAKEGATGGRVSSEETHLRATGVCCMKHGEKQYPVGVFLQDMLCLDKLCSQPIYHSHIIAPQALEEALADIKGTRTTRGKSADNSKSELSGYKTFKHGAYATYHDTEDGVNRTYEEVVLGVMCFQFRGQQRRYVITYNELLRVFSIGAWSSWHLTYMKATDVEEDEDMVPSMASLEVIQQMLSDWATSSIRSSSADQLRKLSELGPASLHGAREEKRRAADRARKEAAGTRKQQQVKANKQQQDKAKQLQKQAPKPLPAPPPTRKQPERVPPTHHHQHQWGTQSMHRPHLMPQPSTPPDVVQLRQKLARLEGEQRVERVAHREGEIEATRFTLERRERSLQSSQPPFHPHHWM